jgi:hypothetical protein
MAYSMPDAGRCPASHPVTLPALTLLLRYPVAPAVGTITLASGNAFSAHGDFWNTWDPATVDRFVQTCLNEDRRCRGI